MLPFEREKEKRDRERDKNRKREGGKRELHVQPVSIFT